MTPEKRVYKVQQMPMTEAAIATGLLHDLYVSLGEPLNPTTWTVRIYLKPFIDWIWGGTLMMAMGGLLAASDRRYRVAPRRELVSAAVSGVMPTGAPALGGNAARGATP
jgi:cytochrome c-type biogenesis protein CcmF